MVTALAPGHHSETGTLCQQDGDPSRWTSSRWKAEVRSQKAEEEGCPMSGVWCMQKESMKAEMRKLKSLVSGREFRFMPPTS